MLRSGRPLVQFSEEPLYSGLVWVGDVKGLEDGGSAAKDGVDLRAMLVSLAGACGCAMMVFARGMVAVRCGAACGCWSPESIRG
jgi:hypothetical protein